MKQLFSLLIASTLSTIVIAQVPKTVVVEHFTNTRCSVCASRNPGFYTNLNQQENTIHLAIHPSAPYPSCILNQANMSENDSRTSYYGIFGSTPRLVIQGVTISASTNYSNQAMFNPYLNQTSPASINLSQTNNGSEIQLRIAIKTEGDNSLGNLRLFAALKENQVDYAAPNGENVHYDVFRKSFFSTDGMQVSLAATGDSVIINGNLPIDSDWNPNQLSVIVILQEEGNKSVVQAAAQNTPGTLLSIYSTENSLSVFPNPAQDFVTIKSPNNTNGNYQIYNALGKIVSENSFNGTEIINVSEIPAGIYFIKLQSGNTNSVERLLIQK
jgi:hypothetical protein